MELLDEPADLFGDERTGQRHRKRQANRPRHTHPALAQKREEQQSHARELQDVHDEEQEDEPVIIHSVAAEETEEQIRCGPDGVEDIGCDKHSQTAAGQRCRVGVATVGDTYAHAGHEDWRSERPAEDAVEEKAQTVRQVGAAIHHRVDGHHEHDGQDLGDIDARLPASIAVVLGEKRHSGDYDSFCRPFRR